MSNATVVAKTATARNFPYMRFTPKKGSFWDGKVGTTNLVYVCAENDPDLCIGKIVRQGRNYVWSLYEKGVKVGTAQKTEPRVVSTRRINRITNAVWALRKQYGSLINQPAN
jgi:hypothetical protein